MKKWAIFWCCGALRKEKEGGGGEGERGEEEERGRGGEGKRGGRGKKGRGEARFYNRFFPTCNIERQNNARASYNLIPCMSAFSTVLTAPAVTHTHVRVRRYTLV